jgi:hypothetical protein
MAMQSTERIQPVWVECSKRQMRGTTMKYEKPAITVNTAINTIKGNKGEPYPSDGIELTTQHAYQADE